ncbi:MAG: 50S ribosomal protein L30 [bacterium]
MAKKKKEQSIKITQLRSIIGRKENQKRTMHALGLRRIRHCVIHKDTPQIRGMIDKVQHLVSVEMM